MVEVEFEVLGHQLEGAHPAPGVHPSIESEQCEGPTLPPQQEQVLRQAGVLAGGGGGCCPAASSQTVGSTEVTSQVQHVTCHLKDQISFSVCSCSHF